MRNSQRRKESYSDLSDATGQSVCKRVPEPCSQLASWTCLVIFIVPQFIPFCVCPVVSHSLHFLPLARLALSSPTSGGESFVSANGGERSAALLTQTQSSPLPPLFLRGMYSVCKVS
ncbi:unnamed protein product [Pipistrellus nathusii]|uniref:Uncharacterized protein n=1 Tax=Pipistrellus nathusii TaxID=59473 RepID=A0ABP0A416_PIPNA